MWLPLRLTAASKDAVSLIARLKDGVDFRVNGAMAIVSANSSRRSR